MIRGRWRPTHACSASRARRLQERCGTGELPPPTNSVGPVNGRAPASLPVLFVCWHPLLCAIEILAKEEGSAAENTAVPVGPPNPDCSGQPITSSSPPANDMPLIYAKDALSGRRNMAKAPAN